MVKTREKKKEEKEFKEVVPESEKEPFPEQPKTQEEFEKTVSSIPKTFDDPDTGRATGLEVGGRTFLGLSPGDIEKIIQGERTKQIEGTIGFGELARKRQAITGIEQQFDPLISGVQERIEEQPSLKPEPVKETFEELTEKASGKVLSPFTNIGTAIGNFVVEKTGTGRQRTPEEVNEMIAGTNLGKGLAALGTAAALTGVGVAISAAVGGLAASTTGALIGKLGASTQAIFGIGAVAGAGALGLQALDVKRGEIETHRNVISEVSSQAQALRSVAESGGKQLIPVVLRQLEKMEREIQDAEAAITTRGALNVKFRSDDEHLEIMAEARDARIEILNAAQEVSGLAIQGKVTLDPEQLIFAAEDLGKFERGNE